MNKRTQQGIDAYKTGDMAAARLYLKQALQQDRFDIQAWLWLSAAVENDADKAFCLQTVLRLNPGNETAQRGLAKLESGQALDESPAPLEEASTGRAAQPEPGVYVPPFIFSEEELAAFEPFLNEPETGTTAETGSEKIEAAPETKSEAAPEALHETTLQAEPEVRPEQNLREIFSEYFSSEPEISVEEEQPDPEPEAAPPAPPARTARPKSTVGSSFSPLMWAVLGVLLLLTIVVALTFLMLVLQGR